VTMHRAVPMFHVPDVGKTADWYVSIGFTLIEKYDDGDEVIFALLSLREPADAERRRAISSAPRRDADLYVYVDDVDALFRQIGDRGEIVEALHDTFYGMREFIIRDINGFWLTFGQRAA
jgi:Glyoxalase/Bleomycin resistance protein/Dioxygenase superfamily